jgi:hypothetical protein
LALSQVYPEAVAGRPLAFGYSPDTGVFRLSYRPNDRVRAPTVVFVPTSIHDRQGYCARVHGARVVSQPGSDLLELANAASAHRVALTVTPGPCGARAA